MGAAEPPGGHVGGKLPPILKFLKIMGRSLKNKLTCKKNRSLSALGPARYLNYVKYYEIGAPFCKEPKTTIVVDKWFDSLKEAKLICNEKLL